MKRRSGFDLEGNLEVFPPELLLQMIAWGRLDGLLTLARSGAECRIFFSEGRLIWATDPDRTGALGDYLVSSGRIERQTYAETLRAWRRERGEKRLGGILVERGLITRAELEHYVREQIRKTVFDAVEWHDGSFRFEHGVRAENEDILLDTSLERLLLECMTRRDQLRRQQGGAEGA